MPFVRKLPVIPDFDGYDERPAVPKPIYSLSGVEMVVRDDDRILLAIMDTKAGPFTSDIDGNKLIGPTNAVAIRNALKEAGFEIVRQKD